MCPDSNKYTRIVPWTSIEWEGCKIEKGLKSVSSIAMRLYRSLAETETTSLLLKQRRQLPV